MLRRTADTELIVAGRSTVIGASAKRKMLVIACCSARKAVQPTLLAREIATSDQATFGKQWLEALGAAEPRMGAAQLYRGRAFCQLAEAAASAEANFAIISAGLGLLRSDVVIPSYSLSLEHGPDALRQLVFRFDHAAWWEAISSEKRSASLPRMVADHDVVLVALTQPYARLLAEALGSLADDTEKLRLFGLGLKKVLPSSLHGNILPYEETVCGLRKGGAKAEFGARALRQHISLWKDRPWCLATEREAVSQLPRERSVTLTRRAANDLEISDWLRRNRRTGSPASNLKRLRQEGLACGSSRFERLWHGVQQHG